MVYASNAVEAIGKTPLIRLCGASARTGCTLLGKAEFMNPGQSVKDRAARGIIERALADGEIKSGGTVIEGTAGNTGIGMALVGASYGLQTRIVIPQTQSEEKKAALRAAGAQVIEVPAVPYKDANNFVHVSRRLSERLRARGIDAFWANQFDNVANREAHRLGTAEEIWDQLDGKIDGFICAVGTGGTLGGVSLGLKAKRDSVVIGLADPHGAALYSYYKCGRLASEGSSITEGIGQGRVTANLEGAVVDRAYRISDAEALEHLFALQSQEGLALGPSSGVNIAGAVRLAEEMGPGHTIVTILCDYGSRYASKLYDRGFLERNRLPVPHHLSASIPKWRPEDLFADDEHDL